MPVLIISDTHINGTVSICPPVVNLDDGGTYHASTWQKQLWAGWEEMAGMVKARLRGKPLILVLNGDLIEADTKDRTTQMITRNEATILSLAVDTLEPFLKLANRIYVVRGTKAHVGSFEEKIAEDLEAVKDPDRGTNSFWHLRRVFDNRRFDITHHIAGNTETCVLNLGRKVVLGCARRGEVAPHYVVRSHVHRKFDTGKTWDNFRVMTTPCWGDATEYVYRIGAEHDAPQVGMLYFNGGADEPEYLMMPVKARDWVTG